MTCKHAQQEILVRDIAGVAFPQGICCWPSFNHKKIPTPQVSMTY